TCSCQLFCTILANYCVVIFAKNRVVLFTDHNFNPETKAKEKVDELTQVLTLSEEQQTAIYTIVLEKVNAKHAIKSDTTLAADVAKQQMSEIKAATHQKIAEQLTEDQKVIFAKYVEENGKKEEEQEGPQE
ncbi:hypothetical protein EDC17_10688, partial [Sphingobacterium alimentarium]